MRVVFVTNYFNHHQAPFAEAMDAQTGHDFFFVETMPMENERRRMGWGREKKPPYVFQTYSGRESMRKCKALIQEADVVIWGSCPFSLIRPRLRAKKLTFAYSERLFKEGEQGFSCWGRVVKYQLRLHRYQANHYLLCASAYAAQDYCRMGLFRDAAFKWGYFPEVKDYDLEKLLARKRENEKTTILWVGRFIGWKHPEASVLIAQRLKEAGYQFEMNLIGNGELEEDIRKLIASRKVEDCVHMLGAMPPEQVRLHMEKANIFLITSDQNEGWGAVLNESMNSGCAVVVSNAIGAAPFLVEDGKNGVIYGREDYDSAYQKLAGLIDHAAIQEEYGKNAFQTICEEWNGKTAARRLCELVAYLQKEGRTPFTQGICSRA